MDLVGLREYSRERTDCCLPLVGSVGVNIHLSLFLVSKKISSACSAHYKAWVKRVSEDDKVIKAKIHPKMKVLTS